MLGAIAGVALLAALSLSTTPAAAQSDGAIGSGERRGTASPFPPAPQTQPVRPAGTASHGAASSRPEPVPTAKPARTITPPRSSQNENNGAKAARTPGDALWTTLGGLLAVVVAIVGLARLWRKHAPASFGGLPNEALEVLGRRPLEPRMNLHLVRVGSRILVVGSSPDGLRTLSEIVDPVEVDLVAGLCRPPHGERTLAGGVGQFLAKLRAATPAQATSHRAQNPASDEDGANAPRTPFATPVPIAEPSAAATPNRRAAPVLGSTRLRDIEIELRRAAGEVVATDEPQAPSDGVESVSNGALTPEQRLAERFVRRREPGAASASGTGRDRG